MDPSRFVKYLQKQPFYRGQIAHVEHIPPRQARYGQLSRPLPPPLQGALARLGIERLYTHQVQAIEAARADRNVMVTTATASGKTLCYNIPVLEACLSDPRTRALYLYPTKALAQDQLRALRELTSKEMPYIRCATYDGDTPRHQRSRLRREATIILSNPDMLHLGILPNHTLWASFFRNLRFVVLDEAHVYRGIFGSHVGCVLRRLHRICALYGSNPQFIACSATIANPGQLLERLADVEAVVVSDDGSPQGAREFVLWNPPFVDRARTARRSANAEAALLLSELVRNEMRTLCFAKARKVAELILIYARRALEQVAPALAGRIKSYRAGYLPEERRRIERELFRGELLGVTATSALELGVDVGSLDATMLVGYPGTIASLWQRAGRAGRGRRKALSILIGLDNPLDQYFMRHPEDLFGRPHEHALLDPGNIYVLEQHLPCAAYELPLTEEDEILFGPHFEEALANLERRGELEYRGGRWYCRGHAYPAERVSLRSISGGRVALLDESRGYQMLEEIEATTAPFRVHPGAIYLHQGESYLVTALDMNMGIAYLRPVEVDYYTEPREINDVAIVRSLRHRAVGRVNAYLGEVRVTQQVIGFRRKQQFSEAVLSVEDLDLPPQSYQTIGLWWEIPREVVRAVLSRGRDLAGGLHAVEHASIAMMPLFAMCDRWDIGGLSTPYHPDTGGPLVFIYDAFPGGAGLTEKGFELLSELWQATLRTVRECPCQDGCPSCIQSPKCGNNNEPLDKQAAVIILEELLRELLT